MHKTATDEHRSVATAPAQKEVKEHKARRSMSDYLANPKLCARCGGPILPDKTRPRPRDSLRRMYCSKQCDVQHRLEKRGYVATPRRPNAACKVCKQEFWTSERRIICPPCRKTKDPHNRKKGKGRGAMRHLYIHSRRVIRERPCVCIRCGYNKTVQGCHIKPVASFPETATWGEINSPDNLVCLCPNCHWEFDHGLFGVDELKVLIANASRN